MGDNGLEAVEIFGPLPRDTENAITVIEYQIRRKRKALATMDRKLELSENEKIKIGNEYDFINSVERLIKAFRRTFHANLGKIPPCDLDYEEAILGALMLHSIDGQDSSLGRGIGQAAIHQVKSFLLPEHFYMEAHKIIYRAIIDLFKAGQTFDIMGVKDRLRKTGQLEAIGGASRLVELISKVSSAANLEVWGRILLEFAGKRALITVAADTLHKCFDDPEDVFDILDNLETEIKTIKSWIK